jgi:hypothetical protein
MDTLLCVIQITTESEKLISLVLQIIQSAVVIIGIPFVILQIRQQTIATRLQRSDFQFTTYMQMMNNSGSLTEMLITDPDLATFYDEKDIDDKTPDNFLELDKTLRKHYLYLGRILSSMEEVYQLMSHKWMDEIDFRASLTQYQEIVGLKKFNRWWKALKPYYRSDFVSFIEYCRNLSDKEFFEKASEKIQSA